MRKLSLLARTLPLALLLGCMDDSSAVVTQGRTAGRPPKPPVVSPAETANKAAPEPSERVYRDSDFVESDQNRDPFRSFVAELRGKAPAVAQRLVLMPDTAIEEMKLIAIVSGIDQPRAMLVDRRGVGFVTTRGDFVGRAEVVQGGSSDSLPVTLNWRIDRIRDSEVVLAREDPSTPGRPPLTRVIPLNPESDKKG